MNTRARSALGHRVYDDFVPELRSVVDGKGETLIFPLHGFWKDQIKVQIDRYGKLQISGERQVADDRWSRFRKEHQVGEDCDASAIRAKFENGVLQIHLPKLVKITAQEQETTDPSLPPNDGKPRAGQELTSQKTILRTADDSNDDGSKQQDAKAGEQAAAGENSRKGEEKKGPAKDTGKSEEVGGRTETADAVERKEEVTALADSCAGGLKYKAQGMCGFGSYWRRQTMLRMIVAAMVLVGMLFYATYKPKNAYTYRQDED